MGAPKSLVTPLDCASGHHLLLSLGGLQGEVAQEVHELSGLASVRRQLRPEGPGQVQKKFLLGLIGVPVRKTRITLWVVGTCVKGKPTTHIQRNSARSNSRKDMNPNS